jgi:hypothetical protein
MLYSCVFFMFMNNLVEALLLKADSSPHAECDG